MPRRLVVINVSCVRNMRRKWFFMFSASSIAVRPCHHVVLCQCMLVARGEHENQDFFLPCVNASVAIVGCNLIV